MKTKRNLPIPNATTRLLGAPDESKNTLREVKGTKLPLGALDPGSVSAKNVRACSGLYLFEVFRHRKGQKGGLVTAPENTKGIFTHDSRVGDIIPHDPECLVVLCDLQYPEFEEGLSREPVVPAAEEGGEARPVDRLTSLSNKALDLSGGFLCPRAILPLHLICAQTMILRKVVRLVRRQREGSHHARMAQLQASGSLLESLQNHALANDQRPKDQGSPHRPGRADRARFFAGIHGTAHRRVRRLER